MKRTYSYTLQWESGKRVSFVNHTHDSIGQLLRMVDDCTTATRIEIDSITVTPWGASN
jgi:hypothetical protein